MKKSFTFLLVSMLICMHSFSLPNDGPTTLQSIRSNLYIAASDGTTTLMDGDLTQYDPSYSNAVDGMDARKLSNPGENIGMIRGTTVLVIERRHTIETTDTIFYKIWNLRQQKNYQLEFVTIGLNQPGLSAYLEDSYLNTATPIDLNDSTHYNFSINADAASSNVYRFRIIFTTAPETLPLTFNSVKASEENNAIDIDWKTANENSMKQYTVQKSTDGKSFAALATIKANNLKENNYNYTDLHPVSGFNYYRIQGADSKGDLQYSDVMKIFTDNGFSAIKVFPNPVAGNIIYLQVTNQPTGIYTIRLVNNFGQTIMTKQIQHAEGSSTETINLSQNIPKGIYQLEVIKPGGNKTNVSLIY